MSEHRRASVSDTGRTMRLALFAQPTGHHQAAWRHPEAQADADVNMGHLVHLARTAEDAKFDAVFFADAQYVRVASPEVLGRVAQYVAHLEPLTLTAALSALTSRIGFVVTASTSNNFPYQLARKLASIDHISGGRIGWNIVTASPNESPNFGTAAHPHGERYERAAEFVDTCLGLWDSWEDDAFPRDKATGIYADVSKLHTLDHEGRFFACKGPLNVPRSPQGSPLLVQAGASEEGIDFACRYADMVFTTPLHVDEARKNYAAIKEGARRRGRDPSQIAVMPGLVVLADRTDAGAHAEHERLQSLLDLEVALNTLAIKISGTGTRVDLSKLPVDEPLPLSSKPDGPSAVYFQQWYDVGQAEQLTLAQLARRAAGSYTGMEIYASAERIADLMEEWFHEGAADGFNIMPPYLPGGFDRFVSLVMPELRRRGLARSEYEGTTLRSHFGLPRPAWHAAVSA